ncbi:hypothetical protein BJ170DRAFT_460719 [Xylariales sp. AK1849]|nr:hypothetical protein BJ170DRAFT_460719 [Xylariales sp. AK1849]
MSQSIKQSKLSESNRVCRCSESKMLTNSNIYRDALVCLSWLLTLNSEESFPRIAQELLRIFYCYLICTPICLTTIAMPAPTTIEANEAPPVKQGSTGFKMIQNHFENTDAKASSAHGSEVGGLPQQKHFKLRNYARASSPAGSARSSFSSRRVSSRRFGGGVFRSHSSSHRSEASRELMVQGESEFFGLMELMTKISWKSNSLKEIWTKLIAERDSYLSEMEKMEEQFEEYAEMIEQKDKEHNQHNHEHEERRQEISKLRLEVTAALASVTQNKKKLHDRDTELLSVRHELNEYRDSSARLREEKISIQTALDDTRSKLALSGGQCDDVRGQLEKSASNFRNINQKYVELQSTHRELNSKHESTRAELVSLTQLSSSLKKEKHDWLREKGEIIENLRKSKHQYDEYVLKVKGVTEKHEKKIQELAKSKEIVSKLGYEKDELHQKVEELKRQLKEKHCKWEDSEDLGGKWKLKSEHSEREIISIREELKLHELEKTQLYETITKNREEIRQLTAEKERISEEFYHEVLMQCAP